MDSDEVAAFEADKDAGKTERKTYGSGKAKGDAPVKSFVSEPK